MDLAIMIEGQNGLTWPHWERLARAAEDLGFAGLYRSDHYTNGSPPDMASLELWVSLTYLAVNTKRIDFGPLVSPFGFRHPSITARMATGVDDLSGGRLQLGLGAGWQEREHHMFGLDLLDVPGRMRRFKEGLEVVRLLLHSEEHASFEGEFYQLRQAILLPRPQRPGGPPITVGGNGKTFTLKLAAQYASHWNGTAQPVEAYRRRNKRLDEFLAAEGRKPNDVFRSLMATLFLGDKKVKDAISNGWADSAEQLVANGRLAGEPDQIVEQLGIFAEAGCQRVMLQWLDLDDIDGLELVAAKVMPQVN